MEERKKFDPKDYFVKINLLGEELGKEWLKSVYLEINYKDPVLWPNIVSMMVANAISPSSKDPKSVRVYAILTEQTEEAMYEYMVNDEK